jgi:hypothetical protein
MKTIGLMAMWFAMIVSWSSISARAPWQTSAPRTTWKQVTNPFALQPGLNQNLILNLAYDDRSKTLYAAGFGVARSTDGGTTWTPMSAGLAQGSQITSLFVSQSGSLLAGIRKSKVAVYRYSSGSGIWSQSQGLYANAGFNQFAQDKAGAILVVTAWAGDVYRSTDDGLSFVKVASNVGSTVGYTVGALFAVAVDPVTDAYYTGGEVHAGLFVSTDHGYTWRAMGNGYEQGFKRNVLSIVFNNANQRFITYEYKGFPVCRINSDGSVTPPAGIPQWSKAREIHKSRDGQLFVSVVEGKAYSIYSTAANDGVNWKKVEGSDFGGGQFVRDMVFDNTNHLYAATVGPKGPALYRTVDPVGK